MTSYLRALRCDGGWIPVPKNGAGGMLPVPAMHQVHQWTGQKQKVGQDLEQLLPVVEYDPKDQQRRKAND